MMQNIYGIFILYYQNLLVFVNNFKQFDMFLIRNNKNLKKS